jgi:hypothetical protein
LARERIRREWLQHLNDGAWFAELCAAYTVEGLLRAIADAIDTGGPEALDTMVVLRDFSLYQIGPRENVVPNKLTRAVRRAVPALVFPALERALRGPECAIRHEAVHTIGKMCFREGVALLEAVFEPSVERDPLALPALLLELHWLGADVWPRVARTATHPHFLVRWATLGWLGKTRERAAETWLICLAGDVEPLVRAEAASLLAEFRDERRPVDPTSPTDSFEMVSLQFWKSMAERGAHDYTIAELEAFVDAEVRPPRGP